MALPDEELYCERCSFRLLLPVGTPWPPPSEDWETLPVLDPGDGRDLHRMGGEHAVSVRRGG